MIFLYLEKIRSNGIEYLYLRKYDPEVEYGTKKRFLFGFGRLEKAREKMNDWVMGNEEIPIELKKLGCTGADVQKWIQKTSPLNKH